MNTYIISYNTREERKSILNEIETYNSDQNKQFPIMRIGSCSIVKNYSLKPYKFGYLFYNYGDRHDTFMHFIYAGYRILGYEVVKDFVKRYDD